MLSFYNGFYQAVTNKLPFSIFVEGAMGDAANTFNSNGGQIMNFRKAGIRRSSPKSIIICTKIMVTLNINITFCVFQ